MIRAPLLFLPLITLGACAAPPVTTPPPAPGPSPAAREAAAVEDRITRVEEGLLTHHTIPGVGPHSIRERLDFHNVPGVSVAVMDSGRIVWARAWGEADAATGAAADTATLFQAASISKPVAATAVMRLVERGELDLDEPVNQRLRSWRVPDNRFTATAPVTLRRLLTHSAGTTVHGFPGYTAGARLPTTVQILDGAGPANTAAVRVDTVPGSLQRYSGGGTTIAQLLMADVTGRAFPDLMRDLVLQQAGMHRSTYQQPLPERRHAEAATAHDGGGDPVAGRFHTYPEMAAAGLWTTPSDLARLGLELHRAYTGQTGQVLTPESAREMLSPQFGDYGIGFGLEQQGDETWFVHGGSNRGFRAFFAATAQTGRGAVVMTNGDGGNPLVMEVFRAIAREYGWPTFQSNPRTVAAVTRGELEALAGTYQAEIPGSDEPVALHFAAEQDRLLATIPALRWTDRPLYPATRDTFFVLEGGEGFAFERDASGTGEAVVVTGVGRTVRAVRRSATGESADLPASQSAPAGLPRLIEQASGTEELLQAVSPVDHEVAWVSGHGATWARTLDGGATWHSGTVPGAPDSLQFRDVHAHDALRAWLLAAGTGSMSRIYHTTDGGRTWSLQWTNREPEGFYDCLDFWDERRGIAYGDAIDGDLRVLLTDDGGATWTLVPDTALPPALEGEGGFAASGLCAETAPGGLAWIAAGNTTASRVLRTTDYGRTWQVSETPVEAGEGAGHTAVSMVDARRGYVFGGVLHAPDEHTDNVARTDDGGAKWTLLTPLSFPGAAYGGLAVPGTDGETLVAVGPGGAAVSVDGGQSWTTLDDRSWWAAGSAGSDATWISGPDGRIAKLAW